MRYILALSAILLFSCSPMKKQASAGSGTKKSLTGVVWEISKIPGFKLEQTRKKVTIFFHDTTGRIEGYAGCNGYGGNYILKGNSLKLEKIVSTKMACMPGMDTENKYMSALYETDNYVVTDNTLVFKKGETVLAEFIKGKKE
jgi:heat shock protein HslJ